MQELAPKHRQGLDLRAKAWLKAQQQMSIRTKDLLAACDLLCPDAQSTLSAQELSRQLHPLDDELHTAVLKLLCEGICMQPAGTDA